MKYVKEFRNPSLVKNMIKKIGSDVEREITIMEVCGTHTMSIFKSGIRDLIPSNIKLISGPGCPVCVTSQAYIDTAIELTKRDDVIITTFGDMLKVPGNNSSLQNEKALGRDIRMVYSPLDSLKIAKENPDREVIFLAVGFETTAPAIALSIKIASEENIKNYSILQSIKTMPETMKQLVLDEDIKIDGFLCPGHVSTVIGAKPYEFLANEFEVPAVIAGFESGDIAIGLYTLIEMIKNNTNEVKNVYSRFVKYEGSEKAISSIYEIFEESDAVWRGLGNISGTGLKLKQKYDSFNAETKLGINLLNDKPIKGCICGDILKGKKNPLQCKLFSKVCNPLNPIGACMVSEEGTCAAYYKYKNIG
ncbi:hydrogenase formation protein HypD [Tepidibacter hydrothermalis]|uniref:Hydrogenase formation protein HypD n=1 Tax=Tepidibacter hydrothermalis TaxID=3036126 RepID=A0ABY8ELC6_9FIRM|nr:hydrogenase formation protein HypD [Tepidibacter hydrothermalis]WFD12255.1 hydrogenase formation protein HypD [Tepidibacter hydrothermalis]